MLSAYNKSLLSLKASLARASTAYHMYPCVCPSVSMYVVYISVCMYVCLPYAFMYVCLSARTYVCNVLCVAGLIYVHWYLWNSLC